MDRVEDQLAILQQHTSPLAEAYFGAANLDAVQARLAAASRAAGYPVSRQSDDEVTGVMRGVYGAYAEHHVTSASVRREVERLDAIAIEVMVEQVVAGARQYLGYLRDASKLPEPMERPAYVSVKDELPFPAMLGDVSRGRR